MPWYTYTVRNGPRYTVQAPNREEAAILARGKFDEWAERTGREAPVAWDLRLLDTRED